MSGRLLPGQLHARWLCSEKLTVNPDQLSAKDDRTSRCLMYLLGSYDFTDGTWAFTALLTLDERKANKIRGTRPRGNDILVAIAVL